MLCLPSHWPTVTWGVCGLVQLATHVNSGARSPKRSSRIVMELLSLQLLTQTSKGNYSNWRRGEWTLHHCNDSLSILKSGKCCLTRRSSRQPPAATELQR